MYDLANVTVDTGALAAGLVPSLDGTDSLMLAVGILGATVMPHVVYLHSALTQNRTEARRPRRTPRCCASSAIDVVLAMGLAGAINLTMLVVAASLFHGTGNAQIDTIEGAHAGFERLLGGGAALAFAVALLASGLSSSSVGTYAGQVVMQGFIARRIPLFARRAVTMTPALIVLAIGLDPTTTLVVSQVLLSFGIPFALVPMILLTRRGDIMGALVNRRAHHAIASVVACLIIGAQRLPALPDVVRLAERALRVGRSHARRKQARGAARTCSPASPAPRPRPPARSCAVAAASAPSRRQGARSPARPPSHRPTPAPAGRTYRTSGTGRHRVYWPAGAPEDQPVLGDACPECGTALPGEPADAAA